MFLKSPNSLKGTQKTFSPLKPPFSPSRRKIEGKLSHIRRFHFPTGKILSSFENNTTLSEIEEIFDSRPERALLPSDFGEICLKMSLPFYAKRAVWEAVCQCSNIGLHTTQYVSFDQFVVFWNRLIRNNHDEASRFIYTLAVAKSGLPGRMYLEKEDFHPILYDIISTYPGLSFLIHTPIFHARYVEVVIVRIFWNVNRSWTGRITAHELRKSNFLRTMHLLETTNFVDSITDYFAYNHFYVIYSKFWELDTDHDLLISSEDMENYGNKALTNAIIDRIFSHAVNRYDEKKFFTTLAESGPVRGYGLYQIGFEEFAAFLLAEEDKKHPTSIEYWFRCLDLDGDGIISLYEMEIFYSEIVEKIEEQRGATVKFSDVVNELFDAVGPANPKCITLQDLKRCGRANVFFNTFVNYVKYLEQESNENLRKVPEIGEKVIPDWEKFCTLEYNRLLIEEEGDLLNDENDSSLN